MIRLLNIGDLRPAAYNPREADPVRLARVELSLRKLGWVLPIYAAEREGGDLEILSGHQRHHVASQIGYQQVPVHVLSGLAFEDRRLLNIAFNRGTNDFGSADTCATVTADLRSRDVDAMASSFPDLDPGSPESYPCLSTSTVPIEELVPSCEGRWSEHASTLAGLLFRRSGLRMPVVVAGGRVINGVGRIQAMAEAGGLEVEVVRIPEEKADLAFVLLNLLTMDFVIHERYADLLRYSNGRRGRYLDRLNLCMIYGMDPSGTSGDFDPSVPLNAKRWVRFYGKSVLDFGAGAGVDAEIMRKMGADATTFEPWAYSLGLDESLDRIDLEESRARVREFLTRVRSREWDTIFMASVLNSVPFDADRRHLVTLIAALATPRTRVYPVAASWKHTGNRHTAGRDYVNQQSRSTVYFALDYEPRILMTGFEKAAKTQRYFTPAEFYDLWAERFEKVRVDFSGYLVRGWVMSPRPLPWERLEAAIRFEFDLPFPEGRRLGLVEEALDAFRERAQKIGGSIVLG